MRNHCLGARFPAILVNNTRYTLYTREAYGVLRRETSSEYKPTEVKVGSFLPSFGERTFFKTVNYGLCCVRNQGKAK